MPRKVIIIRPQKDYGLWLDEQGVTPSFFDAGDCPEGFEKFSDDKSDEFWCPIRKAVKKALCEQ